MRRSPQQWSPRSGLKWSAASAFQDDATPTGIAFWKNVSVGGGPAPARAYIEELLPDVLEGRIDPGRVFDRTGSLDDVPDGYRTMSERESIKFLIEL